MKVYSLGNKAGPTLMLLPGTCCHWKSNFAPVLPLLEPHFHVLCVSYDGFDETELDTTFPTMEEEAAKIEAYINENLGGHLHAAYGCSLGGSFVACWQHGRTSSWISASSAARTWTRHLRLLQSWKRTLPCR